MVQTELDERNEFSQGAVISGLQEGEHLLIDRMAVGIHLSDGRTRQQPTSGPRPTLADRVVVRVEQVSELRTIRSEIRRVRGKDECLEEPGGVRQVPLGGATIG